MNIEQQEAEFIERLRQVREDVTAAIDYLEQNPAREMTDEEKRAHLERFDDHDMIVCGWLIRKL
jgi:hypothetical protein